MRVRMGLLTAFVVANLAFAGCATLPGSQATTSETTTTSTPPATTATTTETGMADEALSSTPSTTVTCMAQSPKYNVSVPAKPENLTRETARELAKNFDRRYERAKVNATYDNVTVDRMSFREVAVQRIDSGFDVSVRLYVQISGEDLHAKWAYPTTYRITEREFERNGRTLTCW